MQLLPTGTRTVPRAAVPASPTRTPFLPCPLSAVGQGLFCNLHRGRDTCVLVPGSIWPLQGCGTGVSTARGWQLPLWLTGVAHQVPTLPAGGGLPRPPRGPPPPCPRAQPGWVSPQAQGGSLPSFCSQALTECGGETLPGPNLLPDLSSVLFSPYCQAVFRRQSKGKPTRCGRGQH